MNRVPDYSDNELWTIRSTLRKRCGITAEIQLAKTELRLDLSRTELTRCPAACRGVDSRHFVIATFGDMRFHGRCYAAADTG